jgi:hypothetical protein
MEEHQSIAAGMALSVALEGMGILVILNALRALLPGKRWVQRGPARPPEPDALDDAQGKRAVSLVTEANAIVQKEVVKHEREDESALYAKLSKKLADTSGLAAMSRAHRKIQHLARLLLRLSTGLRAEDADRYLVRDAQRVIESIEPLVRLHNAQEEDIYEHVMPV